MIGYLLKFIFKYVLLIVFLRQLIYKDMKFKWGVEENEVFEKFKVSIISESIMVYFNLVKVIVVRVEVSYYEGLLVGLFQDIGNGLQLVYFISCSMIDIEKRYSQIEKDVFFIYWVKNRFSIYFLGVLKFKIIIVYKLLFLLFNKVVM